MNNKNIFLLLIYFIFISCKREKIDPCEGKNRTSADFKINSVLVYRDINGDYKTITREVDTLLTGCFAEFTASYDYKSYQYVIGTDPKIWSGKSFYLNFQQPESSIPITLVVENDKPDINCFPGDSGQDTLTKVFEVIKYTDWPLYGEYKGYFDDDPNTEKIVNLQFKGISGLSWNDTVCNGNSGRINLTDYSDRAIFGCSFGGGSCYSPGGYLIVENNKIEINYHLRITNDTNYKRIQRKFNGTKIK